jgi:IS605 OrfB family transposase
MSKELNVLRTLKIRLNPTPQQHQSLLSTLERFNEACNWIAQQAFGGRVTNKIAIQKIVYYAVRERYALSAQMTIRAIAKVAEAYKRDRDRLPTFRPHGAIVYDERILSFDGLEFASLWTLQGRIKVAIQVCGYHAGIIGNSHVRGQADLCLIRGKWYLLLVVEAPDEPCESALDFLGVDLGIVSLATDSDGNTYSGMALERKRRIYAHRRRNLQRKGTPAAKRKLRKIAGVQARFQRDTNHRISKSLVNIARDTHRGIAIENLKGIRDRATVRRKQRSKHANWAFHQLRTQIEYKAASRGVAVVAVDPNNTSRMCSECGYTDKANRPSQALFLCKSCRYSASADFNTALNIRARALVMKPMVASARNAVRAGVQLHAAAL